MQSLIFQVQHLGHAVLWPDWDTQLIGQYPQVQEKSKENTHTKPQGTKNGRCWYGESENTEQITNNPMQSFPQLLNSESCGV